ncbi:MAG: DNA replication and repair protein RecF [Gemmatimonadaceae bacterium]|nr:DNA replication and repair protein RecF [Gemmatimonadaceae bacterium]
MPLLQRFTALGFRNLAPLALDVPAHGLVIVGDNGHGKTNLLEAIAYLHAWRSVRGAGDIDLVGFGAAAFHLAASTGAGSEIRVGFERATRRKKVTVDGVPVNRLADALGALPSVTVSPRDVQLVIGPPSERRRLLDVLLALSSPSYLTALTEYRAALIRRNATIRTAGKHPDTGARAAAWEGTLATAGAALFVARRDWAERVRPRYAELCTLLGEREASALRYRSSADTSVPPDADQAAIRDALAGALERHRGQDMRRGTTRVGPHRDELELRLGGRLLRPFGSAGQHRSSALALRLLEFETLRERLRQEPLLLLDDPFAELDAERSRRVLELLLVRDQTQVILAVPKVSDVPAAFAHLARTRILEGTVTLMDAEGR